MSCNALLPQVSDSCKRDESIWKYP